MASDERTPLIAVVRVRQPPPPNRIRRTCTYILGTTLILSLTAILLTLAFVPECDRHSHRGAPRPCIPKHPFYRDGPRHRHGDPQIQSTPIEYDDLLKILIDTPEEDQVKEWSRYYTSGPHLAGKNLSQAEWTRDRWEEFGIPTTEIVAYDVWLNYPKDHRMALLEDKSSNKSKNAGGKPDWEVIFEASLTEDVLEEDETTGLDSRIPTFHGYSANGNVTAPIVFVNYGTYWDFEDLVKANVSLEGKIALAKYGANFRGLKVKRAQELGMVGILIYSDPGDDGEITVENGEKPYPEGPARNPSAVQRGSTQFLSIAPGDPTTIGYPSKPGAPRHSPNNTVPQIPSLPISYTDALPLLKALNGHGPKASKFNKYWQGGGLGYKGVKYNIGPTPDHIAVNLYNEQEYEITPLWNVIGTINGTIEDEVVILGNHRDAWIAGGAGDPNSGSAALNEVIRSFGVALSQGWKPLRTIIFASWDGEEYGLIGSTEWVEEFLPSLNKTVVAYLNVDVGTTGPNLKTSASPSLDRVLKESLKLVQSPNQTTKGASVYDVWDKHISTMGSGSDFTAFQDFAGIPSLDIGFSGGLDYPVWQYHSNFDSFHWADTLGDPGWHYHATIAKVLGVLTASISEAPIVPLNATDYANGLQRYLNSVRSKLGNNSAMVSAITADEGWAPIDKLDASIARLRNASEQFDASAAALADKIAANPLPWWRWWERLRLRAEVSRINSVYKYFERQFLYAEGLDGRPWFKHVVFAPGIWTGYSGATFPGLVEAVDDVDVGGLLRWSGIILGRVEAARRTLIDGLKG